MKDSVDAATGRSPEWFLVEIVQPTVDDFLLHRNCIRRGMLAALSVSSLADHIAVAVSERSGLLSLHPLGATLPKKARREYFGEFAAFCGGLADRCSDFALVRDVADATKHARLDRDDEQIRDVSGVQRLVEPITSRSRADHEPITSRSRADHEPITSRSRAGTDARSSFVTEAP